MVPILLLEVTFYLKVEHKKNRMLLLCVSGFSAPCDSDGAATNQPMESWMLTYSLDVTDPNTWRNTAANSGSTIRAWSLSSQTNYGERWGFLKNSSSKWFLFPFNISDPFSESISYDPAKAVIETRPSVAEIPGLQRTFNRHRSLPHCPPQVISPAAPSLGFPLPEFSQQEKPEVSAERQTLPAFLSIWEFYVWGFHSSKKRGLGSSPEDVYCRYFFPQKCQALVHSIMHPATAF